MPRLCFHQSQVTEKFISLQCALSIITLHPFSITPQGHSVLPVCELPPPLY